MPAKAFYASETANAENAITFVTGIFFLLIVKENVRFQSFQDPGGALILSDMSDLSDKSAALSTEVVSVIP